MLIASSKISYSILMVDGYANGVTEVTNKKNPLKEVVMPCDWRKVNHVMLTDNLRVTN